MVYMQLEEAVSQYIRDRGIPFTVIANRIGVPYKRLYPCFQGKREFRAC
jgi:hypothetical protein